MKFLAFEHLLSLNCSLEEKEKWTKMKMPSTCLFCVLDGSVAPTQQHPAVPLEDVQWVYEYMTENHLQLKRALQMLRRKSYPFSHDPAPWVPGIYYFQFFLIKTEWMLLEMDSSVNINSNLRQNDKGTTKIFRYLA